MATELIPHRPPPTGCRAWPIALWLFLIVPALASVIAPLAMAQDQPARPQVVVAELDGTITPVMARYVERVIDDAAGSAAVVFTMDTPGGLSSAMDDIIRDILESETPVVVYVSPRGARAASAGVYIAYAAHVSAMAPGTNIGSASPVFLDAEGGTTDGDETMRQKVENDAVAQIRNLAELRSRNADWAESAVREAANITADEALAIGVIDEIAPDVTSLLNQIDGRTVQMASGPLVLETAGAQTSGEEMNLLEQFLQLLADPTVAYLLLSLGLLGIFFELANPGAILPGVVGALGVLLGLYGLGTIPVNWVGVALILVAFALIVVDLFVPSFGLLTIGGIASFVIGSYLLVDADAPPGYELSRWAIWTVTLCMIGVFGALSYFIVRSRKGRYMVGKDNLMGAVGIVRKQLDPNGMVFLRGELWSASLDPSFGETPVETGTAIVVTSVDGLRLLVRVATAEEQDDGVSVVVVPRPLGAEG